MLDVLQVSSLAFVSLALVAGSLAVLRLAPGSPVLPIPAHQGKVPPAIKVRVLGRNRRRGAGSVFIVVIAMIALWSLDRAIFAWLQSMVASFGHCGIYPSSSALCLSAASSDQARAVTATGVAVALVGAIVLATLGRRSPFAPLAALLLAAFLLALGADLVLQRADLSSSALDWMFTAISALLVIACVGGGMLSPSTRGLALAGCFFLLSLPIRFASFAFISAIWPMLFDASRMVFLYVFVVLMNSIFAVTALVGPAVLLPPESRWRR